MDEYKEVHGDTRTIFGHECGVPVKLEHCVRDDSLAIANAKKIVEVDARRPGYCVLFAQ